MEKPYTVIVVLEAKPGKENILKQLLTNVVEPSRLETACLEYRLHQDLNKPTQFILYEMWESKEAHRQQFEKPYIAALANKLSELLSTPYQTFFAQEI